MTDPWSSPPPPVPGAVPPAPPAYGQPAYGQPAYGQPAYGQPAYGQPAYGQPAYGQFPWGGGPPGQVRPTGKSLLLFVVTFGIYGYVYNYKVHDEMKRHSGRGLGGGVALILTFVAGVAMPFVTPSEVSNLYVQRGQRSPVNGFTGLWYILPAVGGYLAFFVSLGVLTYLQAPGPDREVGAGPPIVFILTALIFLTAAVAGAVVWFVKTNGALNRYWQTLGQA